MHIVIDFDGTCVANEFPNVGHDIGAVPVLKELTEKGHKLILFTMRSDIRAPKSKDDGIVKKGGVYLTRAINWFGKNGIPLFGVQSNPTQHGWTKSPKAYGELYIDDSALGCPLTRTYGEFSSPRPFVHWGRVMELLINAKIL